jgi:hypothetical protein
MKTVFTFFALTFVFFSCTKSEPICECFENRLEIKKLLGTAKGDVDKIMEISNSEEFKEMTKKKEECRTKTEPDYFKSKDIERNGRSDKQFLLDELGDCDAVKELFATM